MSEKLENLLVPNNNTLITKNGVASAVIVDVELDPIKCNFNNDGCVEIDTKDYTYLTLSLNNLKQLKKLITLAEKYYGEVLKD